MTLEDIINKSCLIGLSYFDTNDNLMEQTQLAGVVVKADDENGIFIKLNLVDKKTSNTDSPMFTIPASLAPWFKAPKGTFRNAKQEILIENPDYLVTWDIHKTQSDKAEGENEWWNWVPRIAPPQVN